MALPKAYQRLASTQPQFLEAPLRLVAAGLPSFRTSLERLAAECPTPAVFKSDALGLIEHWPNRPAPIRWIDPSEPQISKGWQYFLTIGSLDIRNKRVKALVDAILDTAFPHCGGEQKANGSWRSISVEAELVIDNNKRIDLFIEYAGEAEHGALIIEAKFGHFVTPGQLQSYAKAAKKLADERSIEAINLIVAAPSLTGWDAGEIRKVNATSPEFPWGFAAWRTVLLAYNERLPDDCDTDEFAAFRSTIWEMSYV